MSWEGSRGREELCNEQQGECRRDLLWQQWHGQFSWIVLWRPVHRSHCQSPPHWSGLSPPLDTAVARQGGIKGSFSRCFNKLTERCYWANSANDERPVLSVCIVRQWYTPLGHSLTMFWCLIKLLPNSPCLKHQHKVGVCIISKLC